MKVIVGFDGSASAREALRWAGRFAAANRDGLVVVRSWQYPASVPLPFSRKASLPPADDIDAALRAETVDAVEEVLPGAGAEVAIVRGPATSNLLARAAGPEVRALVLGSRGLGGFSGLLLGSVSRGCLEHASAPVVIVPEGAQGGDEVRRVLVGLDGSEGAARALAWACEVADGLAADLVVATAFAPDQSELRPDVLAELRQRAESDLGRWCAAAEDRDSGIERRMLEGDPRSALLDAAEDEKADLLVVGSRGLGPVSRLVLGSVASALAQHAPVPVAVIPAESRG